MSKATLVKEQVSEIPQYNKKFVVEIDLSDFDYDSTIDSIVEELRAISCGATTDLADIIERKNE